MNQAMSSAVRTKGNLNPRPAFVGANVGRAEGEAEGDPVGRDVGKDECAV